ncbi:hypothetical protein M0812_12028 [Anaeramoeba flamelloides]|uniref:Radical SAM core domain-containing protein n=1 Tax=Anaeramoeba flamelloides TaxID=1746091 RepID=A0AAV7ZM78_9EUKA|nr:hypothetical protein M0812_12028 [Anaeramoeba flamelloides]
MNNRNQINLELQGEFLEFLENYHGNGYGYDNEKENENKQIKKNSNEKEKKIKQIRKKKRQNKLKEEERGKENEKEKEKEQEQEQEQEQENVNENKRKKLKQELKIKIKKAHNKQWSDRIYNILTADSNCKNDCKYCYMKAMKNRFFKTDLEDFTMKVNEKKVKKGWRKNKLKPKLFMFPSSHDIFDQFVGNYIKVSKKIMLAGNEVLIVTKPSLVCIKKIIKQLSYFKKKILFRFTITSDDQDILDYWEPNAPGFEERLNCLKLCYENGFNTSVSIEPYLKFPNTLIKKITPYINDYIWIGSMSGLNSMKDIKIDEKKRLNNLYHFENTLKLVNEFKNNKKILFKTSVMSKIINNI